MGWTRNYYNLLTGMLLGDTSELSTDTPVDYQPPIVVRKQNGSYTNTIYAQSSYTVTPENSVAGGSFFYYRDLLLSVMNVGKSHLVYNSHENTDNWRETYALIQFGSGVTAASYEDYQLETPITSGLSLVNQSGTLTASSAFDAVTHKYSSTRTFTINNSSASSITINELGIFVSSVLCYREVLGAPITIDPGESVTVSFTREATVFNYTPYT